MKKTFKTVAIFCLIATLLCAAVLLAACGKTPDGNDSNKHATTYEVKVLAEDNSPVAGAKVSFAEIAEGKTFESVEVTVDSSGLARFTSEDGNPADATLSFIPEAYVFAGGDRTVRLTKDAPTATFTLQLDAALPDVEYSSPLSGKGTAKYVSGNSGQIESATFNPYVIKEGNYKFKFESAEQRIYLEFDSDNSDPALYSIYSSGGADVSVQALTGSTIGGLFNPTRSGKDNDGRPQFNDNVSETDKNFNLEFSNNESATWGYSSPGVFYFELALENAADAGRQFAVTVEKLDEPYVPKPPTVYEDIHADPAPTKAAEGVGERHEIPLGAGNFKVVRADDGSYRLGGADGPMLYANLDGAWPLGATIMSGQPMTCILRMTGGTNPYRWADADGVYGENWLPFLCEYVGYVIDSDGTPVAPGATNSNTGFVNRGESKCNSDGYYPVNDKIVEFLTNIYNDSEIQHFYFTADNYMNANWRLPAGFEWIFLCGYYGDAYHGEDFAGSGSEQDPYALTREGSYEVPVAAGGKVWFEAGLPFVISSETAGAVLSVGGAVHGGANGFEFALPTDGATAFCVYFADGGAGTIALKAQLAISGDGTMEDPFGVGELADGFDDTVADGAEAWYDALFAGDLKVTASRAGMTLKIYDPEGYLALLSGEDASPVLSWTSSQNELEKEISLEGNYIVCVVNESGEALAWSVAALGA